MRMISWLAAIALVAFPTQTRAQQPDDQKQEREDVHQLAPPVHGRELVKRVEQARQKGFAFLVKSQNADGSWGSHDPKVAKLANFGFQLRNRGSQDGVRMACTAICATALLDKPDRSQAENKALARAAEALLDESRFAYHRGEAFNTWGYGYKLAFLARWATSPLGKADRQRIEISAKVCIDGLRRFQQADGGWNYYAPPVMGGTSMSFNTGTFALAMQRARSAGLPIVPEVLADAVKLLKRMRTVRGGFVYDARFLHSARMVNELSAGSRTVVCALALHDAGELKDADLIRSMAVFDEGENYLESGRKLIAPHTAVHQISGYFFFYGYNYATILAERLGERVDRERWDRFAWTFVRTQEADGAWWDTPAADYGDKWGTGFVLQSIQRYLEYDRRAQAGDE